MAYAAGSLRSAADPRRPVRALIASRRASAAPARRAALAGASAALVVLGAPPFDVWPLTPVALVPLLLAFDGLRPAEAARLAWLAGTLVSAGGTPWWPGLLARYASLPLPVAFAAACVLWTWRGSLFGVWAVVCARLARRANVPWVVSAPLAMAALEAFWPAVFPWHLAIGVWRVWPATQAAEAGGIVAVTALVVLVNVVVAELVRARRDRVPLPRRAASAAVVTAVVVVAGTVRGLAVGVARDAAPTVRVGLVQPNVGILSIADRSARGLDEVRALRHATADLVHQDATLVVWPETAWPFLVGRGLRRDYPAAHPWHLLESEHADLLFGALTHAFGTARTWNSAVLMAGSGEVRGRYDKQRLVPFAERVPLERSLPAIGEWVRSWTPQWPVISRGGPPQTLVSGGLRLRPLICSEDLRPLTASAEPPNLLVGLANDAWFGDAAAGRQHLALAAFRAIESRRDFVRATGTGTSALIDARGRLLAELPPGRTAPGMPRQAGTLVVEPALLEVASIGPFGVRWFPVACVAALVWLRLAGVPRRARRRRRA